MSAGQTSVWSESMPVGYLHPREVPDRSVAVGSQEVRRGGIGRPVRRCAPRGGSKFRSALVAECQQAVADTAAACIRTRAGEELDLIVALGPEMGEADDSVAFACHERVGPRVAVFIVKSRDDVRRRRTCHPLMEERAGVEERAQRTGVVVTRRGDRELRHSRRSMRSRRNSLPERFVPGLATVTPVAPRIVGGNVLGAQAYKRSRLMLTDAQLVCAARNDPDAFAELYGRHACAVNDFLRSRVPERVAGELTAETFAQAALGLKRFRDEADGSALPWLYGIARNLLRTFYERERIESKARDRLGLPRDSYELDVQATNDRLDAERLRPRLSSALDSLPTLQRRALELRVVEELPYRQVASSLGCSEVAARVRVTRALASLSRLLKGASS